MYCNHFGFAEKPFKATPEPRFLYQAPQHGEALAAIMYTIRERLGFVALVGEPGTGKTTLLKAAVNQLDENTRTAFVYHTDLAFEELVLLVLDDLGLIKPGEKLNKLNLIRRLNAFAIQIMAAGGNVVIMLDEAHNLSATGIEGLRLLSNLESEERKLIQVVIAGQTELESKLTDAENTNFRQRIVVKRVLLPLTERQGREYLQHRLTVARYSGPPLFSKKAFKLIHEYSGGVPRLINSICENALVTAYSNFAKTVDHSIIEEVVRELGLIKINHNGHRRFRLFRWS